MQDKPIINRQVALLTYDGAWESSLSSAPDLFQSINLRQATHVFNWEIVTPTNEAVRVYSGTSMTGTYFIDANAVNEDSVDYDSISDERVFDLILIAHFWGDFEQLINKYPQIAPWLRNQYKQGAVLAGVNSGVFWMAEAGLLDGRRATTYWRHLNVFKQRYPKVKWQEHQVLVEEAALYSSNGHNAAVDLTMHLIGHFGGVKLANSLAKDVTFDFRRNYDLTLFNITGFRRHHDKGIHQAQDWLNDHFHKKVVLQQLADKLGMSKSTFIRRFQKSTGEKPSRYLQRLRVESAKSRLINSDDSTKTIALDVGYTDYSYFSILFKSLTQLTPSAFRRQFRPVQYE